MQLIGRLAAEPELTATATGKELVRYALGVSTGPKSGETGERATSWFRVVSFQEGPQRDLLVGLPKGALIYVEAEARMDTFETDDGKKQSRLNLIQRTFETLSRPQPRDDLTGAESDRSVVEEPLSGLGAS
ncbi:ssDNA-binding protein, mitochondrial [Elasticomyces elasticus]|nr:ssDNA-binding protein, mitochondrial [Elasticomyces elasticus]